jgi:hypothetical protein
MTDDAHDMGLAVIINGVAHGLAVYGKTCILLSIGFIPAGESVIQTDRVYADEDITDDGLTAIAPLQGLHDKLP